MVTLPLLRNQAGRFVCRCCVFDTYGLTVFLRCLQNANVVGRLSDGNIPCRFDSDVNAPALAEFQAETSTTLSSCAYITVGTGTIWLE
jgi:hypothetical protein